MEVTEGGEEEGQLLCGGDGRILVGVFIKNIFIT